MKRRNGTIVWFFALALLLVTAQARAQGEEEQWDHCLRQDKFPVQDPDVIIANCRKVLTAIAFSDHERTFAFNNIGVASVQLKKYDEAIHAYNDALRAITHKQNIREYRQLAVFTRRNRASAYVHAKQYEKALEDFDFQASEGKDPQSLGLKCKAHALYDANFASALADCKTALDADKSIGDAYAGWLIVEYRQGAFADVVSDCTTVTMKIFNAPEASYVCGLAEKKPEMQSERRCS